MNMLTGAGPNLHDWRGVMRRLIHVLVLLAAAHVTSATSAIQASFTLPEDGIAALVDAVRLNNLPLLNVILGPAGSKLTSSGDADADKRRRESFIKAYDAAHKLVREGDSKAVLLIGKDEWPMPIPLVRNGNAWRFDTRQGEREILHRRIGRNELAATKVCLAILDAEHEYAAGDIDRDGVPEYAPRFLSTPGKRDGLFWRVNEGEPPSPLGPLLAAAAAEGRSRSGSRTLEPYHGYFYKIMTAQGKAAPGGARSYIVKGKMIGGFAVVAYPARYGNSGITSFIVNQDGLVYENNLGKNSAAIASRMNVFNPDASWKRFAP